MSGIGGLFHRDGRAIDPVELNRIHDAAGSRGVDGGRVWIDGCAGFSHQHLRTTLESQGQQPIADPASGLSITFDGRLDNRAELIRALNAPELRDADDAEIVLRAFAAWREACAARLLGDFAFAVFDSRLRRLYCARDVIGIRPFYYAAVGWAFLFGTELRQVFASGRVSADHDEGAVAEYLAAAVTSLDATFYRYVHRLAPAHWMMVDAHRISVNRYWRLDPARQLTYRDDREYAEHFRSLLDEAVACRMRSAQPRVAAWLSGDAQTSPFMRAASALAAKRAVPQVETFCLDERPGTLPERTAFIEDAAAYRDVPAAPADYLAADLRNAVRERDIRVVLTGAGEIADARVPDAGWWRSLLTMSVLRLLPRRVKDAVRPLARRLGWPDGSPRWIPKDFAARVDLDRRIRGGEHGWSVQALETRERAVASHGLEERHPYYDRRIVEFAMAIPGITRRRNRIDLSAPTVGAIEILGGSAFIDQLAIASAGWIDADQVRSMYRDMMSRVRTADETYRRHVLALWAVVSVEVWYRASLAATTGAASVERLARA